MLKKLTPAILGLGLAGLALLGPLPSAKADTILVFGQNGTASTVNAVNNGSGLPNATTITVANAPVTITAIGPNGGPTPISAFLTLSATSTTLATTTVGGDITQDFAGNFSITGGGNNYLSGTFTDAVFGSGTGLTLSASNAPPSTDTVFFTSSVITALGSPRAISLSFTNVTPPAGIFNGSIASFSASVSGNFSAFPTAAVPEPGPIALLLGAVPTLGLYLTRRSRSRA